MKFETGTYWVGDPCYIFTCDEEGLPSYKTWSHFIDLFYEMNLPKNTFIINTMYGDGIYTGSDGNNYCVDSGLIGVVPFHMKTLRSNEETRLLSLGSLMTFVEPFEVDGSNGILEVKYDNKTIIIDTRDSDDVEYERLFSCCENENRSWNGGCLNCGDPCY